MINTTQKIDLKKLSLFSSSFFLILAFVICVFIFTTCDIDAGNNRDSVNIYSVGSYITESRSKACYWKNGIRVDLPSPPDAIHSSAHYIVGYGNNIYITGDYDYDYTPFPKNFPCYWKNGVRTDLSVPADADYVYTGSVYVSNGNVLIYGFYFANSESKDCYWINGVRTDYDIRDETDLSVIENFIIDNSDNYSTKRIDNNKYILGSYSNDGSLKHMPPFFDLNDDRKACYWEGEIRIDLPSPPNATGYHAGNIYTSGGDIYISGNYRLPSHAVRSCYWKNGTCTSLPLPADTIDSYIEAIYAYNGNVYTAGHYIDNNYRVHICYWKNTTLVDFGVIDDSTLEYGRIHYSLIEIK